MTRRFTTSPLEDEVYNAFRIGLRISKRQPSAQGDYERAVIEQAMLTECVSVTGRYPSDVIRDIIQWHVSNAAHARPTGDGMVSVAAEDANNYCRILTALGMEEEGDPVAEVERLMGVAEASTTGERDAIDLSKPLETSRGDTVRHVTADAVEIGCAHVCVDVKTGRVYSSPYIGTMIRNAAAPTREQAGIAASPSAGGV